MLRNGPSTRLETALAMSTSYQLRASNRNNSARGILVGVERERRS
jgi:hypothetical protein